MQIPTDKTLELRAKTSLIESDNTAYIKAATSVNTRVAYQSDIRHYENQGGVPKSIESYLLKFANTLRVTTLERRVYALRKYHQLKGWDDPTVNPLVQTTLKGIKRLHGKPPKEARAFLLSELDMVSAYLKAQHTKQAIRDRALLLLDFAAGFRRSEVVALSWDQIEFVQEGIVVKLLRNKTDQYGEGQVRFIPVGNEARCPVRALLDWREVSKLWSGPIFRRISKTESILNKPITAGYWNTRFKTLCQEAGVSRLDRISSHSLRRGFATAVSRKGAGLKTIMQHGGWKSTKTVLKYIEEGRQFSDSVVRLLYEF